jgi:hypothetical protein
MGTEMIREKEMYLFIYNEILTPSLTTIRPKESFYINVYTKKIAPNWVLSIVHLHQNKYAKKRNVINPIAYT